MLLKRLNSSDPVSLVVAVIGNCLMTEKEGLFIPFPPRFDIETWCKRMTIYRRSQVHFLASATNPDDLCLFS